MNYRHQFHAGNFADVLKHTVLLHLLDALQAKGKGIFYLDTHAGRGGYDLEAAASGASRARTPEWPDGLGRLLGADDVPAALAIYLAAVRRFDAAVRGRSGAGEGGRSLRFYPGSPALAQARMRPQDRAGFCERQPDEAAALGRELGGRPRVVVHEMDGYTAMRALLPPPERRALVLIDPPFETDDEGGKIVDALSAGLDRLAGGTFVVWYPLTERVRADAFYRRLLARPKLPPCYTVELLIGGETAGLKMWGCGVLVLNPPWGSARPLDGVARWLAPLLARAPGAMGGVHWLVPEK